MTRRACLESKLKRLMTPEEENDTFQIVAYVFVLNGVHVARKGEYGPHNAIPFRLWKQCFRQVRFSLRMNAGVTNVESGEEYIEHAKSPCSNPEELQVIRDKYARRARYAMHQIRAAFAVSTSRKRKAEKRGYIQFLRLLSSQASRTGSGLARADIFESDTKEAISKRHKRFKDYCDIGEAELTRHSLQGVTLYKTSMGNALANVGI